MRALIDDDVAVGAPSRPSVAAPPRVPVAARLRAAAALLAAGATLGACAVPALRVDRRDAVTADGTLVVDAIDERGAHEVVRRAVSPADFPLTIAVADGDAAAAFHARLIDATGRDRASGDGELAAGVTLDPADERIDLVDDDAHFGTAAVTGHQLVLASDGGYTIAWTQGRLIRARAFDATGVARRDLPGSDLGVVRIAPRDPSGVGEARGAPSLVAVGDHAVFGHEATAAGTTRVEFAPIDRALVVGAPIAPALFADGTTARAPVAAPLAGDRLALAWLDAYDAAGDDPLGTIHVAIRTATGAPVGNAELTGELGAPQLAPLAGGVAVAYVDLGAGELRLTRLDPQGHVLGTNLLARATDPLVRIAAAGDGAVVAWIDRSAGDTIVHAVAVAADGTPGRAQELVRPSVPGSVALAASADGVWLAWSEGTSGTVDATHRLWWAALDTQLVVRTAPRRAGAGELAQVAPSIAARDRDRAVVTWTQARDQAGVDTSTTEIRARLLYAGDDAGGDDGP